jgi:ABC-type transporter Mla MlaB component
MNQKELDEFLLAEKDSHIEVKPKFTQITPEMEAKLIQLLNTAYFAVKSDIRLDLSDMKYVTSRTRLVILDFSKEMKKESRKFSVIGAPKSFLSFLNRFQINGLIHSDP